MCGFGGLVDGMMGRCVDASVGGQVGWWVGGREDGGVDEWMHGGRWVIDGWIGCS